MINSLSLKNNANVLDYGCGSGSMSLYLGDKYRNMSITGYDISSKAIECAKESAKKLGLSLGFTDNRNKVFNSKYDLIFCFEVLEHLDDHLLLNQFHKTTKENSLLFLSVPSLNSPLYKLKLLDEFDKRVGHLRRYNMATLTELLEKCGFKVVSYKKTEGIVRNSLFTFPVLGKLIRLIKGPLVYIFHYLDELTIPFFGESDLIIIAQKK